MKEEAIRKTLKDLIYDKYLKSIHDQIVEKIIENNEEIVFTDWWDSLGSFEDDQVGKEGCVDFLIEKNPKNFFGSELGFFIRLINKENTEKVYGKDLK